MKRLLAMILAVFMVVALTACSGGGGGGDKPAPPDGGGETTTQSGGGETTASDPQLTLNYSTHVANVGSTGEILGAWLKQVEDESGGSINIEEYWSASLVPPTSAYAETSQGVCDINTQASGMEGDHFIIGSALSYFYYGEGTEEQRMQAVHEVYATVPGALDEYSDVEILGYGNAGAEFCIYSTKPIRTIDDLKGLNIRIMEDWVFDVFMELGAAPVKMPLGQMYESIEKGAIDAILLGCSNYVSENLADYVQYMTYIGVGSSPNVWTYVNNISWDKMSDHQKEIMKTTAEQCEKNLIENVWSIDDGPVAESNGVELIHFSEEDTAKIIEVAKQKAQEQIDKLNAAGLDGQAIFDAARAAIEKYIH